MKIIIETIPHEKQRYPTCGDWFYRDGTVHIRVSKLSDERFCALVAVHELVEWLLCWQAGVSQRSVDKFDREFEKKRLLTSSPATDEPGDEPDAPYCKQHCFATGIERLLAAELGVPWREYEEELNQL